MPTQRNLVEGQTGPSFIGGLQGLEFAEFLTLPT